MTTYRNTSDEWGADVGGCTPEIYREQAVVFGCDPKLVTADDEHIYYDGKPIADAEPITAPAGGREMTTLQQAIRDELRPEAVALIIAHLQTARCNDEAVTAEVAWFSKTLSELVGGPDMVSELFDVIGV